MTQCCIGIDFGTKNIGLSISDSKAIIALIWRSFPAKPRLEETIEDLLLITSDRKPTLFVVGLPLTLKNTESRSTARARAFIKQLELRVAPLPVVAWDERLTSAENERALLDMGRRPTKRSPDAMAARTILQSYLDVALSKKDKS